MEVRSADTVEEVLEMFYRANPLFLRRLRVLAEALRSPVCQQILHA